MTQAKRRPRRPGATIEDVARAAGVSRQTVSNVLNAPHRVRPDTLARVTQAIERLGYQPDQSARSLRTGSRRIIGYLAPVDDPFDPNPLMGGFLEALVDAAGAEGHRVLLVRPPHGAADPRPAIDELIAARQVDGFVLADVLHGDARVAHIAEAGVPFAAFGRTAPGTPQQWVDVDSVGAMASVVDHLAGRGHRRIGYLGSTSELPWMTDRLEGFSAGLRRHGLDDSPVLELTTADGDTARTVTAVRGLLRGPDRPTAFATGNDMLALTAYEAIRAEGLTVGRDVAVVGFHDIPLCRLLNPRLTSVRLPLRGIAAELVRRLLAQVRGEPVPGKGLLLPAELIARDSTPAREA
ncbi:LacI family DNA-binding transcriptional regulator [Streptomyces sp. NPDC051940]|uniref:LacI family DNA-binding transcriptional regulator n=1 Tax=Streptomyces sp. NPDC051940 TaxID=3155675 RepID=UPI0034209292